MTKKSEALEEALLHLKQERERADAAEAKVAELEKEKKSLNAKLRRANKQADGDKFVIQQNNYEIQALRAELEALQGELDPNAPPPRVEVMSFIDDCGHSAVINMTGTAQKLKVYRELIQDALDQQAISLDDEHYDWAKLLKEGSVEDLRRAISDSYIGTGGCSREGFDAVPASSSWPKGTELCS